MRRRVRVEIQGAVQGVGFRPCVYRLARESALFGWVVNDTRGVVIELEGDESEIELFFDRLSVEKPPPSTIDVLTRTWVEPTGATEFVIGESTAAGRKTTQLLPDIATCEACLREVNDPGDRRHGYPFTNCTHCGPRLTIIRSLPYDRARTSMKRFAMCPACAREYADPTDRRFHAQPNACPTCGPRLAFWSGAGKEKATGSAAVDATVEAICRGEIVAIKGLGGFHLVVDARRAEAVRRLRERKPRRDKPLALMVRDVEGAKALCRLDATAETLLRSSEAPIVLLPKRPGTGVAAEVAPDNRCLGLMLPYTPLHHLLMQRLDFPIVATSGNLSDEPICIDEHEAVRRLGGIADRFLIHDRPIVRHVDDSIVRVLGGGPTILRRARGYAPRPVLVDAEGPTLLAVGGHVKNTVALGVGRQVFVSPHIGDMETPEAHRTFERAIEDFLDLYDATPVAIAHDLHPDYASTRWASRAVASTRTTGESSASRRLVGVPLVPVQHHHAHLAAVLAENGHSGTALGVTWDGTGYGTDGSIWGGEFLLGDASAFDRVAHLHPFRLPGGDAAVREPRRSALALLHALGVDDRIHDASSPLRGLFTSEELDILLRMLDRGLHAPVTTSAGRLFDGVAALTGIHPRTSFEGQAAMAFESAADDSIDDAYPFVLSEDEGKPLDVDWRPMVEAVLEDSRRGIAVGTISARFHSTLAEAILHVARRFATDTVALTGGCFQNDLLLERTTKRLRRAGFEVLTHRLIPPNDGGISLGQIAVATALHHRS